MGSFLRRGLFVVGLMLLSLSIGGMILVQSPQAEASTGYVQLAEGDDQGTLDFTCDVRNAAPTDMVSCRVTIDGAAQPDVAATQTVSYTLAPGDRDVLVEMIGEQAGLFDPAYKQQIVKIITGKATKLKVIFIKKGHLLLSLDQTGVVADFFVDGAQIATQVAVFDGWISSGVNHKVEVKNLTDPASAGVYTWKDARQNVVVRAGTDKTITFRLRKQYHKGFLVIKCKVAGMSGASCVPTIDGVGQPAIAAGASTQYTLDPGSHTVVVAPEPMGSWKPASISRTVRIWAGMTQTLNLSFKITQPSPTPTPDPNRLPILTMGACNPADRGYLWGPNSLAINGGFTADSLMSTDWAPPECWPDGTAAHPSRKLTVAECAVFYYKPLTIVLFPNRQFNGKAYYDDVARLIRHIENYERELGISKSKKVVMGPVSYDGGVIGSPNTVISLGAGVVDLPDIIQKTRDTTGFVGASDNVHLVVSPYFFGIVDTVVRKAIGGTSGIYTIEPAEIPPYVP